jgi:translation initiation factor 3 subunit D
MVQYSPSIDIRPEWSVLEQVQVPLLSKLSLQVGDPTDYEQCGALAYYDRNIDRVAPKNLAPMAKSQCAFRSVTASDDPILQRMATEGKARVFFTDSVLTALMCTQRSVYSWDIIITRRGKQLWFDKRPDSVLDKESVNETAPEGVPEDDSINGVAQLSLEATAIRQNFSQQCLDRTQQMDLGNPNPFAAVCSPHNRFNYSASKGSREAFTIAKHALIASADGSKCGMATCRQTQKKSCHRLATTTRSGVLGRTWAWR